MALLNQSVQVYAQLPKLFETLREGQAPEKFTREFLKDIGFKSSNHHAFIPLLKGLGFLTSEGAPTTRYKEFLDKTKWKKVLAEAVLEAYGDIFVLKSKPAKTDRDLIAGKYKSTYNVSDIAADRAARTFLALLELADETLLSSSGRAPPPEPKTAPEQKAQPAVNGLDDQRRTDLVGFHYNIQIHLPATKDVEVYNAIFKSLRENLID
jgi:hypothetical protein